MKYSYDIKKCFFFFLFQIYHVSLRNSTLSKIITILKKIHLVKILPNRLWTNGFHVYGKIKPVTISLQAKWKSYRFPLLEISLTSEVITQVHGNKNTTRISPL